MKGRICYVGWKTRADHGCGWIHWQLPVGSYLCEALISAGAEVTAMIHYSSCSDGD